MTPPHGFSHSVRVPRGLGHNLEPTKPQVSRLEVGLRGATGARKGLRDSISSQRFVASVVHNGVARLVVDGPNRRFVVSLIHDGERSGRRVAALVQGGRWDHRDPPPRG